MKQQSMNTLVLDKGLHYALILCIIPGAFFLRNNKKMGEKYGSS